MFDLGWGEDLPVTLINAALLALWAALPGLLLLYVRQSIVAKRLRPEFSLRKSEASELDRAIALYDRVCCRLQKIESRDDAASLWRDFFVRRAETQSCDDDEREDLEAHAHHLRATIMRLKRRPLQRLKLWVHIMSSRIALSRAVAAHVAGFALVIATFHLSENPAWGHELTSGVTNLVVWYPLDERVFYANAIASGVAAATAIVFYFVGRAGLRHAYELEFCTFGEFANGDLSQLADRPQADHSGSAYELDSSEIDEKTSCFALLGVSDKAAVDEIKEAYKTLIKQSHPDRVHGMSPAFRELAETETKKLNVAYQQAMMAALAKRPIAGAEAGCAEVD